MKVKKAVRIVVLVTIVLVLSEVVSLVDWGPVANDVGGPPSPQTSKRVFGTQSLRITSIKLVSDSTYKVRFEIINWGTQDVWGLQLSLEPKSSLQFSNASIAPMPSPTPPGNTYKRNSWSLSVDSPSKIVYMAGGTPIPWVDPKVKPPSWYDSENLETVDDGPNVLDGFQFEVCVKDDNVISFTWEHLEFSGKPMEESSGKFTLARLTGFPPPNDNEWDKSGQVSFSASLKNFAPGADKVQEDGSEWTALSIKNELPEKETRKFIVLASQRSGSTWFIRCLDSHPDIAVSGSGGEILGPCCTEKRFDGLNQSVWSNVETIMSYHFNKPSYKGKAVGIKFMYNNLERSDDEIFNGDAFFNYLVKNKVTVLHNVRQSQFLRTLSNYYMNYGKEKNFHPEAQKEPERLRVDPDIVLRWMLGETIEYNQWAELISRWRSKLYKYEEFYYEVESKKDAPFDRAKKLLDVKESVPLTSQNVKAHPASAYKKVIENWDELIDYLSKNGYDPKTDTFTVPPPRKQT